MAKKEVFKNEEEASIMLYCGLINKWTMKIVTSAQVTIFIGQEFSDDNCIVILLFNNCFEIQFPLSPIITTSDGNDFIW